MQIGIYATESDFKTIVELLQTKYSLIFYKCRSKDEYLKNDIFTKVDSKSYDLFATWEKYEYGVLSEKRIINDGREYYFLNSDSLVIEVSLEGFNSGQIRKGRIYYNRAIYGRKEKIIFGSDVKPLEFSNDVKKVFSFLRRKLTFIKNDGSYVAEEAKKLHELGEIYPDWVSLDSRF